MILLTKDKTRAKRPGLFLTQKCYPQKNMIRLPTPSGHAKGISFADKRKYSVLMRFHRHTEHSMR